MRSLLVNDGGGSLLYIVAYDLRNEKREHHKSSAQIVAKIEELGTSRTRIQGSVWLIATQKLNAAQIFTHLKPALDSDDRVFISRVTKDYSRWMTHVEADWVRKNL